MGDRGSAARGNGSAPGRTINSPEPSLSKQPTKGKPPLLSSTSHSSSSHSSHRGDDELRLTVSDGSDSEDEDAGSVSAAPTDAFSTLCEAIEARLQLTSKCLLLLTRILKELRASAAASVVSGSSVSSASLLPSLRDALNDGKETHRELLTLHERLLQCHIDKSLSKQRRHRRRRRRQQLSEDVRDVSQRFSQVQRIALQCIRQPEQQQREMVTITSPPPSSSSSSSAYSPPPSYQQESAGLLSVSADGQELVDAEQDAAHRASFIEQIERDVGVVHELFTELHSLVSVQGDSVDRLEQAMTRTHLSTRQAVDEIFKAERYARDRRRRVCCLWLTALLAALILLFVWKVFL